MADYKMNKAEAIQQLEYICRYASNLLEKIDMDALVGQKDAPEKNIILSMEQCLEQLQECYESVSEVGFGLYCMKKKITEEEWRRVMEAVNKIETELRWIKTKN